MSLVDWSIVGCLISFIIFIAVGARKHTKSVADFLAANRCAGRYMVGVSEGLAAMGSIGIIASFEMYYKAGFVPIWWMLMWLPIGLVIALTGWVMFRFRETRAMTLGQFLEIRYSKSFRIFAGILGVLSGVINFGIFPAVSARFFIHFCGIPETIFIGGITIGTFPVLMAVLILTALFLTVIGGQIAVILVDFVNGLFVNVIFLFLVAIMLWKFDWNVIMQSFSATQTNESLIHPFHTSEMSDFNIWYFLIGSFGAFYTCMAWQGSQGFNCCAASAHEAKMGRVIGSWRQLTQGLVLFLLPVCVYTVMHHPNYASQATDIRDIINTIDNPYLQEQMTVPIALGKILPIGALGAFCAVMVAAFISTHDTYLHSWGSIFIQDVILPLRKKPFSPRQHLLALRVSILCVAIFIFCFSMLFKQTEYILMFFAITGAIFLGGAGSVIIGGLYWKRGTTAAAWSSMITGSALAITGVIIKQLYPTFFLTGQIMMFIAMISSTIVYITVSLLGSRFEFDMDKMLHRDQYKFFGNDEKVTAQPTSLLERLGINKELPKSDKIIYLATTAWTILWFIIFIVGTLINCFKDVTIASWSVYWKFYVIFSFIAGTIVTIWLTVGGLRDMKVMYQRLRTVVRDHKDDGTTIDRHNLDEQINYKTSSTDNGAKITN